jgi:hypothetical protein
MSVARGAEFTDIFLFSHGWNNTWPNAISKYEDFLVGYSEMGRRYSLDTDRVYKPMLIGIFWPSAALVDSDEKAPQIAGTTMALAREREELAELAELVPPSNMPRIHDLLQAEHLSQDESLELASLVRIVYDESTDEIPDQEALTEDDIVAIWAGWAASRSSPENEREAIASLNRIGTVGRTEELQAAGFLQKLRPRDVLRAMTVWQMKDRAGVVGANGVCEMVTQLLGQSEAHLHLIGHSYGCKVVLSSIAAAPTLSRKAQSMLLLQPAVSHLCFAAVVPERGIAGGYVRVPDRVQLPVMTTYSRHDFPLRKTFHLALRRKQDLAEQQIAAPDTPPSVHAALGGFGPRGVGDGRVRFVQAKSPTRAYDLSPDYKVIAIDGSEFISGHSDISNAATWWALHQLVAAG